eukprot:161404-Pleurochrysis_carterae.AAC.1
MDGQRRGREDGWGRKGLMERVRGHGRSEVADGRINVKKARHRTVSGGRSMGRWGARKVEAGGKDIWQVRLASIGMSRAEGSGGEKGICGIDAYTEQPWVGSIRGATRCKSERKGSATSNLNSERQSQQRRQSQRRRKTISTTQKDNLSARRRSFEADVREKCSSFAGGGGGAKRRAREATKRCCASRACVAACAWTHMPAQTTNGTAWCCAASASTWQPAGAIRPPLAITACAPTITCARAR